MAANKENIHKIKTVTRIPLPVEPLPALPKHLVESKRINSKTEVQNERHPLRTITQQNSRAQPQLSLPGTSNSTKYKHRLKVDTRYVTVRQKDDLEFPLNVFKDVKEDDSVIFISDDEKEEVVNVEKKRKSHESRTAVTPALKSTLEPNRVKNIKRSLKRPHSRELIGLSPVNKEQRKGDEHVRRKLCFTETVHEKLKSPDFWKKSYMKCLCQDYTTDMFTHLFEVEQKVANPRLSTHMRACVINWLMRVNTADGNPAIIQTACWYLDAVLSTGQVEVDKLQLIAAACYWIAHKLHGPGLHSSRLIKASNYAFTTKGLLAAEKAVLERLTFPRQPVVPQEYITYLSWWCDNDHPGEIEVGATFLTMCFMIADKRYCSEYPSVIAAAAVRNTLVLLRKMNLMTRLQACPVFKSAEKKAESLSQTCSLIRRGARAMASPAYEYKAPFEQYGVPPHCIAQRIIEAASEPLNARNTATKN